VATSASRVERFAYEVVRRVLGAEVEHVDDNRTAGQFDALIHYRDGNRAALEVTTIADQRALQMRSFETELRVDDSPNAWTFRYPGFVNMREARRHIPVLVRWCDTTLSSGAFMLPDSARETPDMQWLMRSEARLDRSSLRPPGRVLLLPSAMGGFTDPYLSTLESWLLEQQTEPWLSENQSKLARSGLPEQHLFALVHSSGIPFALFDGLLAPDTDIAAEEPDFLAPITDLWLLPEYGSIVTRWSKTSGWSSHDYGEFGQESLAVTA
jgi:hypothetical protein